MARATNKPTVITGTPSQHATACPACGEAIAAQAVVDGWLEPPGWDFWGRKGERWLRCSGERNGYRYTHFLVVFDGRYTHRLAWQRLAGEPAAAQGRLL